MLQKPHKSVKCLSQPPNTKASRDAGPLAQPHPSASTKESQRSPHCRTGTTATGDCGHTCGTAVHTGRPKALVPSTFLPELNSATSSSTVHVHPHSQLCNHIPKMGKFLYDECCTAPSTTPM